MFLRSNMNDLSSVSCFRAISTGPPFGLLACAFSTHRRGLPGRVGGASFAQCCLVSFQVSAAYVFQFVQPNFDSLGLSQHFAMNFSAPMAKLFVAVACCDLKPRVQFLHRLDSCGVGLVKSILQLFVLDGRKDRRHVLFIERDQSAKRSLAYLHVGSRQRRAQVLANLFECGRNRFCVTGIGTQTLIEWGVWAGDVNVRIDGVGIKLRVAIRPLCRFKPE